MKLPDNPVLGLLALFAPPLIIVSLAWWGLGAYFFVPIGVFTFWLVFQVLWAWHCEVADLEIEPVDDEDMFI